METIRVNMTPCEDIKTIHASQNDNEARQWGFELHNNGDKIDSSSISDQLVFKAYEGGTEEILPENGSTPTTSPFKGDIKYPQGLLSDQEFLYRESPTEEDGLAKITDIKGNTLNWNQLQQSASASQTTNGITYTVNNDGSITANGTATATSIFYLPQIGQLYANHKYLAKGCPSGGTAQTYMLTFRCNSFSTVLANDVGNGAIANGQNYNDGNMGIRIASGVTLSNAKFYPQVFDLTQMGLDISSPSDFTSLFPLPYYAYNQGTLLSFMGNGIKTVGKNLINNVRIVGQTYSISGVSIVPQADGSFTLNGTCNGNNVLNIVTTSGVNNGVLFLKGSYILSGSADGTSSSNVELQYYIPSIGSGNRSTSPISFTLNEPMDVAIRIYVNNGRTYNNDVVYPMLRFADVEDSTFEPYTSSTLSLPISTYFPTGMKSAGSVYDELTETKAITRIGAVNMGTLSWTRNANYEFFYATLTDGAIFTGAEDKDLLCPIYTTETTVNSTSLMSNVNDKTIRGRRGIASCQIYIKDTSYTSATDLVNALQGIPLYYELATPTETSFTTASLVTENAEIPLSNNDGVLIGKCTEQLSENPGFIDAKIKLTDANGECYSNKIQLHIERSPQ